MKDLERATGVSRETIRYYIREGLLPEPERPDRNVAWYDASFVERILLIKRLQSERFLPLSVIKGIVGDARELTEMEARALHALDGQIAPAATRAEAGPHPAETLTRLAKRVGLPVKEIRELADAGAVEVVVRDGKPSLEGTSVAIVESWARLREAGFIEEMGFSPSETALYVETLTGLAREELRRVGARIPAKVDADTARRLADTSRRLDDSLGQLAAAQIAMASGVLALCNARGLTLTPEQHARIVSESDAATLTRWLTLAATASDAAEILSPS
jgi:DNA-binding transcriptional MerR regulator